MVFRRALEQDRKGFQESWTDRCLEGFAGHSRGPGEERNDYYRVYHDGRTGVFFSWDLTQDLCLSYFHRGTRWTAQSGRSLRGEPVPLDGSGLTKKDFVGVRPSSP